MRLYPLPTAVSRGVLWGILFLSAWSCSSTSSSQTSAEGPIGQDLLRYEKTHCFGPCPVFQAAWKEDGTATLQLIRPFLEGPLAAMEPGAYVGKWDLGALDGIEADARSLGYGRLEKVYDNPRVMDVPSVITRIGGHEVKNRFGGPNLKSLYSSFDALMEATQWTQVPPSNQ
jgi:hypothetical protein